MFIIVKKIDLYFFSLIIFFSKFSNHLNAIFGRQRKNKIKNA